MLKYQILSQSIKFFDLSPPYSICHFEFLKAELEFLISDPKNVRVLNFIPIEGILNLGPPYWIRHFEFLNFDLGFVMSDPKNPRVLNFKFIQRKQKFVLQRVKANN